MAVIMDERHIKWSELADKAKASEFDVAGLKRTLNSVYGASADAKLFIDRYADQMKMYYLLQKSNEQYPPKIKNVIFNNPATIVFWSDGTKTVVKCQDDDIFDPEKGLAMAVCKKAFGNKGNYCNELKKWLPKEEESEYTEPLWDQIAEAFRKAGDAFAGN